LSNLIKVEAEMTNEVFFNIITEFLNFQMRSVVRIRDLELNRLEKACEASLVEPSTQDADKFDGYSRELSELNAKIRVGYFFD
jgi:hypothetical protein